MKKQYSQRLLTRHKTLSYQCHFSIAILNATSNLLFQSYSAALRRPVNTQPTIDAIYELRDTMENCMLGSVSYAKRGELYGIYSGVNLGEHFSSIKKALHDQEHLDQNNLRTLDGRKKRHLSKTEYTRVFGTLQAIEKMFKGYLKTFTWAYPSNDTPYNQAWEIVLKVQNLQHKLQCLHDKEAQPPTHKNEWESIFSNLDHNNVHFEETLAVLLDNNYLILERMFLNETKSFCSSQSKNGLSKSQKGEL